ncbi:MAG: S1 RNA-binding domain-containing protein, partial [Spirochaetota bacterium]
ILLLKSGSFYRAISLGLKNAFPELSATCLENIFEAQGKEWQEIWQVIQAMDIRQEGEQILLNAKDVTALLQTPEMDILTPEVSKIPIIRHFVNELLRGHAGNHSFIAEGRDMGTVVFPQAECKFFLDASIEVRARRRYEQWGGRQTGLRELREQIQIRDEIDRGKKEGALRPAENAYIIDTSNLTLAAVCQIIAKSFNDHTPGRPHRWSGVKESPMSDNFKSSTAEIEEFNLADFEQALAAEGKQSPDPDPGSKLSGIVIKVSDDEIFIDINSKAEGRISRSEFEDDKVPQEGDSIEVIYQGRDSEGNARLSFTALQRAELESQLEVGRVVSAKISKLIMRKKEDEEAVPVGFQVQLAPGMTAFLPLSQVDLYPSPPESYVGRTLEFRIERIEEKGRHQNIVVNRRKLLEEELHGKQQEFFSTHQVGAVVKGHVRSFVDYGAFIDLGGFSGLLHVMNMAWHPVKKPQDYLQIGQELELQITDMDSEKKKIGLSLKAMLANPWDKVSETYTVDQVIEGKVMRLQTYGAFVELEPGIEGLIHVSEMSWIKQIKHPKEVLRVGDQVKVQILEMDLESQRIRLGLRQTQPNPWLSIAERYPVGTRLTLPVKNIIKGGAFLVLEEGIDGFLHQDDLSWVKRVDINSVAKVGETLEVQVLSVDPAEQRIRLGVKQLENNPWQELKKFKKGTVIEGTVVNKTDFGIFVAVHNGIEGLVHKNDLTNDRNIDREDLLKNYKEGDKVRTLIVEVDEKKRRLGLSIKALERSEEQQSMNQYLVKNDDEADSGVPLGDFLVRE